MNKLKIKKIINWLHSHDIYHFSILEDKEFFKIDVNQDVTFKKEKLLLFPIEFNHIKGNFNCSSLSLISLKGAPLQVEGAFICQDNELTSLEFCPPIIGSHLHCGFNRITTLKFSPKTIRGGFSCNHNQLSSLVGGPNSVAGPYICSVNNLTSLEFCPIKVGKSFSCDHNNIGSLQFIPEFVGESFKCHRNPILGVFQETTDFSIIQQEYSRLTRSKELALNLESSLPVKKSKNSPKI